jgi:arylsulfatase A-like enzyme
VKSTLVALLNAVSFLMVSLAQAREPGDRPNIVIMLADDLGYGDLSVHGCRDIPTPAIDSIALGGARCTDAYVTAPLCAPSRASLLTGRYQDRFGFQGNPARGDIWGLPLSETTLADRLRDHGYHTGCIGKWHLGETDALHPLNRGFDEFFGFLSGMHSYRAARDPQWGDLLRGRTPVRLEGYLTDAFANEAASFVTRNAADPWFLYLAFNAPHTPLEAPADKLSRFTTIADERRRAYAAMVSSLDDGVGRVLEALRSTGQERRTIVFFLSDNGGSTIDAYAANAADNSPLRGSKGQLWEGGIRVPLFVRWPDRIPEGRVVRSPVASFDVFATAVAAADGACDTERIDGRDILPLLDGRSEASPHHCLHWRFYASRAIRERGWKWVESDGDGQGLFDLTTDPEEAIDRHSAEEGLAAELRKRQASWEAGLPGAK